ncbi:hypothetical protein HYH03_011452 [Edaphochlamys debaryana]|uniref:Guanylate cyclase domain-containing protein n=1 Tax=Edaphochlamys debaryana TaxID=47281 RepID=A0A835XW53_9CHLO|nr:hypothetical protein HYH03_011452 [Edaphochlamys debaryana]|eukprot:KAG2490148.1 hypothetical protein HYH03_011452 [Edaphochlamys debaryana]
MTEEALATPAEGPEVRMPMPEEAEANPTPIEPSAFALWIRRRRRQCQVTCGVMASRPSIPVTALLVLAALLTAGLVSVLTAARAEVDRQKDLAYNGVGNGAAQATVEALRMTVFASDLLSSYVTHTPYCDSIAAQWDDVSADIFSRINRGVVKQLEIDMAAVIWKVSPKLPPFLEKILMGRDLLGTVDDRPGTIERITKRDMAIMGPYQCAEGYPCMFTVNPIFLPAPNANHSWGCPFQPTNCSECWSQERGEKWWGQVSTMLNMDPLVDGDEFRLQSLRERGYHYKLWQSNTSPSNPEFVLAVTDPPPSDPVVKKIEAYNLVWYLELSPSGGWYPSWVAPCVAAVVVGSLAVALLVLWLLLSRAQHDRLLRAMLPPKVIKQLQSGETAIAQEYGNVTILFSDIVGYTTVASQLSPFQVVTLLNELFTVFDELTQKNGVYKVETIGDAIMCVSGCPCPDDPVRSARRMAHMALDMVQAVRIFRSSVEGVRIQIRVGVHSGPVVAGVVGRRMPRFCLFGDTVNTASRMESSSHAMKIQVSEATAELLRKAEGGFRLEPRGPVSVKGKGTMDTFFLAGSDDGGQPGGSSAAGGAAERQVSSALFTRVSGGLSGWGRASPTSSQRGSRMQRMVTVLRLGYRGAYREQSGTSSRVDPEMGGSDGDASVHGRTTSRTASRAFTRPLRLSNFGFGAAPRSAAAADDGGRGRPSPATVPPVRTGSGLVMSHSDAAALPVTPRSGSTSVHSVSARHRLGVHMAGMPTYDSGSDSKPLSPLGGSRGPNLCSPVRSNATRPDSASAGYNAAGSTATVRGSSTEIGPFEAVSAPGTAAATSALRSGASTSGGLLTIAASAGMADTTPGGTVDATTNGFGTANGFITDSVHSIAIGSCGAGCTASTGDPRRSTAALLAAAVALAPNLAPAVLPVELVESGGPDARGLFVRQPSEPSFAVGCDGPAAGLLAAAAEMAAPVDRSAGALLASVAQSDFAAGPHGADEEVCVTFQAQRSSV